MSRRVTARRDPEQSGQWEPWLVALDAEIAAEDREDRKRARYTVRGLPKPKRGPEWLDAFAAAVPWGSCRL